MMKTLEQAMTKIEQSARIVYVMCEEEGMIKIGISKHYQSLGRRLSNLQAGNPRKLSILFTKEYENDGEAYAAEQSAIKAFAFYNYGMATPEWFDVRLTELTAFIISGTLPLWEIE